MSLHPTRLELRLLFLRAPKVLVRLPRLHREMWHAVALPVFEVVSDLILAPGTSETLQEPFVRRSPPSNLEPSEVNSQSGLASNPARCHGDLRRGATDLADEGVRLGVGALALSTLSGPFDPSIILTPVIKAHLHPSASLNCRILQAIWIDASHHTCERLDVCRRSCVLENGLASSSEEPRGPSRVLLALAA